MIRRQPSWYDRWHGAVMIVFDSVFHHPHIADTYVLPAYANPKLSADSVHLTDKSGQGLVADTPFH
jgi:hypothetical protein